MTFVLYDFFFNLAKKKVMTIVTEPFQIWNMKRFWKFSLTSQMRALNLSAPQLDKRGSGCTTRKQHMPFIYVSVFCHVHVQDVLEHSGFYWSDGFIYWRTQREAFYGSALLQNLSWGQPWYFSWNRSKHCKPSRPFFKYVLLWFKRFGHLFSKMPEGTMLVIEGTVLCILS